MTTATSAPEYARPVPAAAATGRASTLSRALHSSRLGVALLLSGTAVLYLWNLGASGNANSFYAAAVQAGTKSWKAFFFGSLDSGNFITVDKPPASLWVMELSSRIFGFSSWAMLVPQALEGVAAVGMLYLAVRRWFGPAAGLLAGSVLALTPVAALMFRFNNPDALMTLLLVVAAYATTRAVEAGSWRWLSLAGTAMGFDFLTKSLQPFTVLPALALVYLVAAPVSLRRRIGHVLTAGAAVIVSAGWWVLAVALWPAADRPYIGGSSNNSVLGLAFGYNGLGRITGNETGGAGGGGGGGGGPTFSGSTGLGRLFNSEMGSQISWLLPAALLAMLFMLVLAGRRPRTDRLRAATLLWGGWLVVTGVVLSYASGIIHAYYTVQLAPAIAALVGIGGVGLWRARELPMARAALGVGIVVTGGWAYHLLGRSSDWQPWLRYVVVILTLVGAVAALIPWRRAVILAAAAAMVVGLAAPAGYAFDTVGTPQQGSTPSAGPAATGGSGFGGGGGFGAGGQRPTGGFGGRTGDGQGGFGPGAGGAPGGSGGAPTGALGGGAANGETGTAGETNGAGQTGTAGGTSTGETGTAGGPTGGIGGGQGGTTSSALSALLEKTTSRWAAATIGDQSAASLELASGGKAVMAIGGWDGSDPAPTLAEFKAWVAAGDVHYFIAGGQGGGRGGNSDITSWVEATFSSTSVGGSTVYDLTQAKG